MEVDKDKILLWLRMLTAGAGGAFCGGVREKRNSPGLTGSCTVCGETIEVGQKVQQCSRCNTPFQRI